MKIKILITGGTGFVGSYLMEELRKLDTDIKILSQEKLNGKRYVHGDIRDKDLDLRGYDIIYHLAALSNPKFCEDNKRLAWDVNVNGVLNLLERLEKRQKIIFASSAQVYGRSSQPHLEDEPLDAPNFYGLTKKVAEELIGYYSDKKGFAYAILRFFNIYGPRQDKGFLISDVIEKYRTGGEIKIIDPEANRDFIYISDVADVLIEAINANGIYNIGFGRGTRIGKVYSLIRKELGAKEVIEKVIKSCEDALIADITKAEKELNWRPKVGLEEGIRRTIMIGQ